VGLLQVLAVGTGPGRALDQALMAAAGDVPVAVHRLAAAALGLVELPTVALALAVLTAVAVLRGVLRAEVAAAGVVLGATLTTLLLKASLTRPDPADGTATAGSLPSGHVTLVAALAVAAVLVSSPRLVPVVAGVGAAATGVVAAAVLVEQWHRPSDVAAALLVVAGWAAAGSLVLRPTGAGAILGAAAPGGRRAAGRAPWRTARAPRSAGSGATAPPAAPSRRSTPRR
jgi:membrane-associated phospholipid phosphatase